MAVLNAVASVNTLTFSELGNVVNGTFAGGDPDGGWQSFDAAEMSFVYPNAATLEIRLFSQAADFALATQILFQGTVSSLAIHRNNAEQFNLSGFTPFDINSLYTDAQTGLTTFPALLLNGNDTLNGSPFADVLYGFNGADIVNGGGGADEINGGDGNDIVNGGDGNDIVNGGGGADQVNGGLGNDNLTGGGDADTVAGGLGADTLFYLALTDSTKKPLGRDIILDFSRTEGDQIDLTAIDAKKGGVDNKFKFIGKDPFSEHKGELHYKVKKGDALVTGDVDGDGKADFGFLVDNVTKVNRIDFDL